jgi:hypothetical protein
MQRVVRAKRRRSNAGRKEGGVVNVEAQMPKPQLRLKAQVERGKAG